MGDAQNLSGAVSLDTTDFKTHLREMDRDLRVLESGFRASAAGLGDWSNNTTALEARTKSLTSQIEIQTQKVAAVRAEYERLAAAGGADSKAAEDMQIKLNKETETLGKMQSDLQETNTNLQNVKTGNKEAGDSAAQSVSSWQKLNDVLAKVKTVLGGVKDVASGVGKTIKAEMEGVEGVLKVGAGAILGLGSAAAAAGSAVAGFTFKEADNAKTVESTAQKYGMSVQRLQELSYIGNQLGVDLDTITSANSRLIKSMDASQKGTSTQARAFRELGVQVRDSKGQLLDSNTVFNNTMQALSQVQDPTERDALAMELFGRSAAELGPLADEGAAGLANLTDEAHKNGAVVSTDAVNGLAVLQDKLTGLKSGLSGLGMSLAGAFAPFFGGLMDKATGGLQGLVGLFQNAGGDINKIINGYTTTEPIGPGLNQMGQVFHQGIVGMVTGMVKDLAAQAPKFIQGGLTIVNGLVTAIISALPQLLAAGAQIIQILIQAIVAGLPMLGQVATTLLGALSTSFLPLLPSLMNVGLQILETLAKALMSALPTLIPQLAQTASQLVTQLLTAIQMMFPQLLPIAVQLIQTIISFLQNNLIQLITVGLPLVMQLVTAILMQLPLLVQAALQVIIALANGLTAALPTLVPVIVQVVVEIVNILLKNLPMLVQAALQLILALVEGIVAAFPQLIVGVDQIMETILTTLLSLLWEIIQFGGQLVLKLIEGIIKDLPELAKDSGAPQIIITTLQALADRLPKIEDAGKSIVKAIWQGIQDEATWLWNKVKDFCASIVKTIDDAIGHHSPAALFVPVGVSIPQGIWQGIENNMPQLQRKLTLAMQGLTGSYPIGMNGRMPAFAGATAGVGAGVGGTAGNTSPEIHLHIGTLVADRAGLEQLERSLLKIRQVEEVRKG